MHILILGARGMLGRDLMKCLQRRPVSHRVTGWDIEDIDITDGAALTDAVREAAPDVVINCAAYTAVDRAEEERDAAFAVNVLGAGNAAVAAKAAGAKYALISTDYVFDGLKISPYTELDEPHPAGHYGNTKLKGERLAQEADPGCLIVRTQWLYGKNGKNFVETMLMLADTRPELTVVDDQHGSPTWTVDLSKAVATLVEKGREGIYHASNSGQTTWYDFAKKIFEISGKPVKVVPIKAEQYKALAKRPNNSVFDLTKLIRDAGYTPRRWDEALEEYLSTKKL